jgi:TPR repeat protein
MDALDIIDQKRNLWIKTEFVGDAAALAEAAKGGGEQAQLAVVLGMPVDEWMNSVNDEGDIDVILRFGLLSVLSYIGDISRDERATDIMIECVRRPAEIGSATAQHVVGMLLYVAACDSGDKVDLLEAARWIREAAMQGVMEAQYELGEMFRSNVFCDIHMRFARNYIRRASKQGHAEAIERMKELRSCISCGADAAPRACSLCQHARYCDATCSEKHWREGGGVGGGLIGGSTAPHKGTCPRTHMRRSDKKRGTKLISREVAVSTIWARVSDAFIVKR